VYLAREKELVNTISEKITVESVYERKWKKPRAKQ
jgi:hypothetical protein